MMRVVAVGSCLVFSLLGRPTTAEPLRVVAALSDETAFAGAHDVELHGRHAFVCGKGGSLAVVDVADPTRPRIVWSQRDLQRFDDPEVVLVSGKHLFLGSRDFAAFDISQPDDVRLVGSLADRERIDRLNGFARRGDFVFAANKEGRIVAFDISRPERPRLYASLDVAVRDGIGKPHDIAWLGEFLLVVDPAGFGRREVPGQVGVYRVFDPKTNTLLPVEQWECIGRAAGPQLVGGNRIRTIGRYAFVAASISPQATNRERKKPCLAVVDMTDPTNPQIAASIPFSDDRGPNGMEVAGNVVFVSGGKTVAAIDVTEPRRPNLLGQLRATEIFRREQVDDDGHDLVYRDGYLYLTGQTSHAFGIVQVDDRIRHLAAPRD